MDAFVALAVPLPVDARMVDLGVGDSLSTTVELLASVRARAARALVVAVDHDASRLAIDPPDGVELRRGGFDLPVEPRSVDLVRAMNVLRGYPREAVADAHARMARSLVEGGYLIEGTSDAAGHVLTAHVLRSSAGRAVRHALLFATDFERGFAPWMFRDHLPRDLRRDVRPGTAIHTLLARWDDRWTHERGRGGPPAALFTRSAVRAGLTVHGPGIATHPALQHRAVAGRSAR